MFQTVQPKEIFDPRYWQVSDSHPAYWLAQLRKPDWQELLQFLEIKAKSSNRKPVLASAALERFEFSLCEGRSEVWQTWIDLQRAGQRGLLIQFRHSEMDWSRGVPEFVDLARNEALGFVNIAMRLMCKVK